MPTATSFEIAGNISAMNFPEICLCSRDTVNLIENADRVQWVEWRADLLGYELPIELSREKILWTYRTSDELFPDDECVSYLIRALHTMGLVDMQLIRDEALLRSLRHRLQQKVIVSFHGMYEGVKALETLIRQMRFFPRARNWKIALDFSKSSFRDLLECLIFLKSIPELWQKKLLFVPMGLSFPAARLWSVCQLSSFLYTCVNERSAVISDQPNLDTALAFQRPIKEGVFYALLGSSVKQSPSHLSHNAVLSQLEPEAGFRYLKFALSEDEMLELLSVAKKLGIVGFSVTMPYKELALKSANTASALAREVGAANLLVWKEEGWHADNTDAQAFIDLFDLHKIGKGSKVLVLGAGGGAKAALSPLAKRGSHITIVSRSVDRALAAQKALSDLKCNQGFSSEVYSFEDQARWLPHAYDLIIQTTPLGMNIDDIYPFDFEQLSAGSILFEIVNGPSEAKEVDVQGFRPTALASYWLQQKRRLVQAEEFFIRQASYQFENWLGHNSSSSRARLDCFFS